MSQLMGGTRSSSAHVWRTLQQVLGVTDFDDPFTMERVDRSRPNMIMS